MDLHLGIGWHGMLSVLNDIASNFALILTLFTLPYFWEFMIDAFLSYIQHISHSRCPRIHTIFPFPLLWFSVGFGSKGYIWGISVVVWHPNSLLWTSMDLFNSLYLLQKYLPITQQSHKLSNKTMIDYCLYSGCFPECYSMTL